MLDDITDVDLPNVDDILDAIPAPGIKAAEAMAPPKRKRRTKAEMEAARAAEEPVIAPIATTDEAYITVLSDLDEVHATFSASHLAKHTAEIHPQQEPDGTVRRVEFRALPGTTFNLPGVGHVVWATYVGDPKGFKRFLSEITVQVTIDA